MENTLINLILKFENIFVKLIFLFLHEKREEFKVSGFRFFRGFKVIISFFYSFDDPW